MRSFNSLASPGLNFLKNFTLFEVGFFVLLLLFITFVVVFINKKPEFQINEGFYPVTAERISLGEIAQRRYNEYSDMIDNEKMNVVPNGVPGDKVIDGMMQTPTYEGSKDTAQQADLNYTDERELRAPPEVNSMLGRIRLCESVKRWECEAFENPEFAQYCGICTGPGEDHLGKAHMGGLYINPQRKDMVLRDAATKGISKPKMDPTAGICKGEFILARPYCDVQKDRMECSKAQNFDDPAAKTKCGLCLQSNGTTFVYIGNRAGKEANYALKPAKPVSFTCRLRFAVSDTAEVEISVKRPSDNRIFNGAFVPGTNVYIVDIDGAQENQELTLLIRYPEYNGYAWTGEDRDKIRKLTNPNSAKLVRAMYGPVAPGNEGGAENAPNIKDDPRAADVSKYMKDKFGLLDCSRVNVNITNDGLGGDPTPGIYKQLRIAYSDNGTDFAYAYGKEGGVSTAASFNYSALCPPKVAPIDAEKQICETNIDGSPTGRIYTQGRNADYAGAGGAWCIKPAVRKPRGVVGVWESLGRTSRSVPMNLSVTRIDGFNVGENGPPTLGTVKRSKYFASKVPESRLQGIPKYLFWFWSHKRTQPICEFSIVVPVTLRDPTIADDMSLCPIGPIISTPEGSTRMAAGACEQQVNGVEQGPGTYTIDCIKSIFLSSGCLKVGRKFPVDKTKAVKLMNDPETNRPLDIDDIGYNIQQLYSVATTGADLDDNKVEDDAFDDASLDCLGKIVSNPCDTAFKDTGPHTPKCLDLLFRNAGKDNPNIGQTYPGMYNFSSGTDRTKKVPVMYCQRKGSMAPIGADGKENADAMSTANSFGSVQNVRDFYRQIHYDANFSQNATAQKIALNQCYGVRSNVPKQKCKGIMTRFVRVKPSTEVGDSVIQIAQLQVFDIFDVNVALRKPTTSLSTWANGADGATSDKAVDGATGPRPHPQEYHSGGTGQNEFWQVDLGEEKEVSYVVYMNRTDCCGHRARGMTVQLLDSGGLVLKSMRLSGAPVETLMFSSGKPAGLIKPNTQMMFVPGKYLGSAIKVLNGSKAALTTKNAAHPDFCFVVVSSLAGVGGAFSFKHKATGKFLRGQGFNVLISPDDGTPTMRNEASFKVLDSVAALPGEVSYESLVSPGSFLSVAENMLPYIRPAKSAFEQKMSSWRIVNSTA